MDDDRPSLVPYVWEEIALSLHEVDKTFWEQLKELRLQQPTLPLPPKQPEHLRTILGLYATHLFLKESDEYPVSPKIELWLSKLADRVLARVIDAVDTLDSPPILNTILGMQHKYGLTWHGLTPDEMKAAIRESLDEVKALTLGRYQTAIEQQTKSMGIIPAPTVCEPSPSSDSDQTISAEGIIEHRRKLLEEYKTATGNPPNQRIYRASNSRIHKPEFYQWINGILPERSKVTKRFEEFLRAKRLPIPRNPTT